VTFERVNGAPERLTARARLTMGSRSSKSKQFQPARIRMVAKRMTFRVATAETAPANVVALATA